MVGWAAWLVGWCVGGSVVPGCLLGGHGGMWADGFKWPMPCALCLMLAGLAEIGSNMVGGLACVCSNGGDDDGIGR